jgi:hypothetical protein
MNRREDNLYPETRERGATPSLVVDDDVAGLVSDYNLVFPFRRTRRVAMEVVLCRERRTLCLMYKDSGISNVKKSLCWYRSSLCMILEVLHSKLVL